MPSKIRLLSDAVANRIAAGEVVHRPAAAVKELLENAVDAHSTFIILRIEDGGKTLIQVIDDGDGMDEVDARLCFERHATSKLQAMDDLATLHTFGFRGEALAAIGSVAQVDLMTRSRDQLLGTHVCVEGGERKSQEPIQTAAGTQVKVKNLFYNIPARRSFLRKASIEQRHVMEAFHQVALARPDITFHYYEGQRQLYRLPKAQLGHRIVHLFGKSYREQLIPCGETTDHLQITGYIGTPKQAKKTKGGQYFFVNERYVRNNYLHHAVKKAFEGLIPPDTHPFYVLFITLPPHQIDVNVHPTKTEVKFEEERALYAILTAVVKNALAAHHITPPIDFEQDLRNPFGLGIAPTNVLSQAERAYAHFEHHTTPTDEATSPPSDSITFRLPNQDDNTALLSKQQPEEVQGSQATYYSQAAPSTTHAQHKRMQLHHHYILAQVKSGLLLIDQRGAHERILYEKWLAQLTAQQGSTQLLLLPQEITLTPHALNLFQEHAATLAILGFRIEAKEHTTIQISGTPPEVAKEDLATLIEELLATYEQEIVPTQLPLHVGWARTMARRTSTLSTMRRQMKEEEMEALIDQLFACANPNYTPDGKKIWCVLTQEKLAELLNSS